MENQKQGGAHGSVEDINRIWTAMPAGLCNEPFVKSLYKSALAAADLAHVARQPAARESAATQAAPTLGSTPHLDCLKCEGRGSYATLASAPGSTVADIQCSECKGTGKAGAPQAERAAFQQRVQPWMMQCFGPVIAADRIERNHRFLEEALELVQSCGCTVEEAHQLVEYVYGRPVGEVQQEVGGVMVTLAALCLAQGLDMHAAGEIELARIWTKVDAIRAKQAAKPKHSPLPSAPSPAAAQEGEQGSAQTAVRAWLDLETASREAICAYNEAVRESDKYIWPGTDINAEFQVMSDAKNKAFHAMHAMYDALIAAQIATEASAQVAPADLRDAARDVLAERRRQVDAEGWTPGHDDAHTGGSMAEAAACYITGRMEWSAVDQTQRWPWSHGWWKPKSRRRDLVRAAALLIAEIERLDRAALRSTSTPTEGAGDE